MFRSFAALALALSMCAPSFAFAIVPFGGAILEQPIPCDEGIWVPALSTPTPGTYMWVPGTISYLHGPPAFISQWLLGVMSPTVVPCTVGGVIIGGGPSIIFHGSSGVPGALPPIPTPPQQAQQPKGQSCTGMAPPTTPAEKRTAEKVVRSSLAADSCGISVNRPNWCGVGQTFQAAGGCTDTSNLQCNTITSMCDMAQKCGKMTLSGGSELGHTTHSDGDAADLVGGDTSCMIKSMTAGPDRCGTVKSTGKSYCFKTYTDKLGNKWVRETYTPGYNTGDHWHMCIKGGDC